MERRDTAAHADEHFSLTAERVFAQTVVAHVRAATIGVHAVRSSHPFVHEGWSFAHNGTVRGFRVLREWLHGDTDPRLADRRRGDTDSDAAMHWI